MRLAIAAALAVTTAGVATAKVWPTPAAGLSVSGDPEVVFTFDDGPNPTWTPKVLDILKQHNIRAIFFMVGEMVETPNKKIPPIVERILREGHVIANHTMTHADLCRLQDPILAAAEIDHGKAAIERVAKVPLVWFRAPFGVRCDRLDAQLAERNTAHMHWDLDPQEWKHGSAQKTVDYITSSLARSTARNVVLLHDIKMVTVKALPQILDWISAENERRRATKRRPIRIVQAPQLAYEQLSPGLAALALEAVDKLRDLRTELARTLPAPPARKPAPRKAAQK